MVIFVALRIIMAKKKKSLMATLGSIPENYNIQEGRIAIAIIISNEPSATTTTASYDDRW